MSWLLEIALGNIAVASLMAVGVYLLGRFWQRPAVMHTLWCLVLLRLVWLPVFAWHVPLHQPATSKPIASIESLSVNMSVDLPPMDAGRELMAFTPVTPQIQAEIEPAFENPMPFPWHRVIFLGWGAGALTLIVIAARRIARFHRILGRGFAAEAELQAECATLAAQLGLRQVPQVWLVPGTIPPLIWSLGGSIARAKLVLPCELLIRLDTDQRLAILGHELAHLKRGDSWVRWLELFVTAVYWWFPLLGWMRCQLRHHEEACCDAWVIERLCPRRAYALALVETVDFLNDSGRAALPELASGMAAAPPLEKRLRSIMSGVLTRRLSLAGLCLAMSFGIVALSLQPVYADEDREESKGEKEKKFDPRKDGDKKKFDPKKDGDKKDGDKRGGLEKKEGDREGVERARLEVQRMREQMHIMMENLQRAERRLAEMEGRPIPPRREGGPEGGPRREGDRPPPPMRGGEGGPGERLERIERMMMELRREIEAIRGQREVIPPPRREEK